jgi:hypothetical protein
MIYTGVLGLEVGFGGLGWVLRLFLSLVLGLVLEYLGLFLLRRLGRGFVDFSTIALMPSSDGASLSSGSLDVSHRRCGIGGVSPCARPLGFRIVLMNGVNYRYTVIVRVGIRVGGCFC